MKINPLANQQGLKTFWCHLRDSNKALTRGDNISQLCVDAVAACPFSAFCLVSFAYASRYVFFKETDSNVPFAAGPRLSDRQRRESSTNHTTVRDWIPIFWCCLTSETEATICPHFRNTSQLKLVSTVNTENTWGKVAEDSCLNFHLLTA